MAQPDRIAAASSWPTSFGVMPAMLPLWQGNDLGGPRIPQFLKMALFEQSRRSNGRTLQESRSGLPSARLRECSFEVSAGSQVTLYPRRDMSKFAIWHI